MIKHSENTEPSNSTKPVLSDSSLSVFLDYEIRSSWWTSWIGWNWGQELSARYFAWKTSRKYARYKQSKMWEQRVKNVSNTLQHFENQLTIG